MPQNIELGDLDAAIVIRENGEFSAYIPSPPEGAPDDIETPLSVDAATVLLAFMSGQKEDAPEPLKQAFGLVIDFLNSTIDEATDAEFVSVEGEEEKEAA